MNGSRLLNLKIKKLYLPLINKVKITDIKASNEMKL